MPSRLEKIQEILGASLPDADKIKLISEGCRAYPVRSYDGTESLQWPAGLTFFHSLHEYLPPHQIAFTNLGLHFDGKPVTAIEFGSGWLVNTLAQDHPHPAAVIDKPEEISLPAGSKIICLGYNSRDQVQVEVRERELFVRVNPRIFSYHTDEFRTSICATIFSLANVR